MSELIMFIYGPGGIAGYLRIVTSVVVLIGLVGAYLSVWQGMIEQYADSYGDYTPAEIWIGAHIALVALIEVWAWFG